jgi:hypothetical protein
VCLIGCWLTILRTAWWMRGVNICLHDVPLLYVNRLKRTGGAWLELVCWWQRGAACQRECHLLGDTCPVCAGLSLLIGHCSMLRLKRPLHFPESTLSAFCWCDHHYLFSEGLVATCVPGSCDGQLATSNQSFAGQTEHLKAALTLFLTYPLQV